MFNPRRFLNKCDNIVEDAVQTSDELRNLSNYQGIARSLKNMPFARYYNTRNFFYGSRTYGLATSFSDLDLFIDVHDNEGSNYYGDYYTNAEKVELLGDINNALESNRNWVVNVYLPDFKVPLIRAKYLPENMHCDIITDNGLGVAASDMIEHLFEIQPEAKYFFHFVREWFSQQGLNFKTYTLAMLVIFFFQSENLMPSVERVQRNVEPVYIDDVQVQFDANRTICSYGVKKLRNYKDYLEDFFDLYGSFDFQENFISVVEGRVYPYSTVRDNPDMSRPMSVSSILQNEINSAKLVGWKRLNKFQQLCDDAADILSNNDF